MFLAFSLARIFASDLSFYIHFNNFPLWLSFDIDICMHASIHIQDHPSMQATRPIFEIFAKITLEIIWTLLHALGPSWQCKDGKSPISLFFLVGKESSGNWWAGNSRFTQRFSDSWKNKPQDSQLPIACPVAGMRCQEEALISLGPRSWRILPIIFATAQHSDIVTTHMELQGSLRRMPFIHTKTPDSNSQKWGEKNLGDLHFFFFSSPSFPYLHALIKKQRGGGGGLFCLPSKQSNIAKCRGTSVGLPLWAFAGQIMWQWVLGVHMCMEKWVERGQSCCYKAFFPTSCQHNQNNSLTPNKIKCRIQKPSFPPAVCLDPIPWSWAEKARGSFILALLLLIFLEWKILSEAEGAANFWQKWKSSVPKAAGLMGTKVNVCVFFLFSFFLSLPTTLPFLFHLVFAYHI